MPRLRITSSELKSRRKASFSVTILTYTNGYLF